MRVIDQMRMTSCLGVLAVTLASALPTEVHAQTDFYNTDRGRPVQIEDAYVTDRLPSS